MVKVTVKLKNRKPMVFNVRTVAEGNRMKRFVGREGKVEIKKLRK